MIPSKVRAIRREAEFVLNEVGIISAPVSLDKITTFYGIQVSYELGDDISGILIAQGGTVVIGVNPHEPAVRQRFTVAHEIGHFRLHRKVSSTFVDKDYLVLKRSGERSELELEANAFAAELLMPEDFINYHLDLISNDFDIDEKVRILAKKFEVSTIAMTYRLTNLRLI